MKTSDSNFYTTEELAKFIGVSTQIILKWAKAGKIPCIRINSRLLRFSKEEIKKFLDERTSKRS